MTRSGLHESNELEFSCERQGDRVQRVVARQDQIKEDGRAFEIKNIKILGQYRDPEYCLEYENEATMSPTGEWTIFCLRHPDGHWYRGRWDESKSALDIDLFTTDTARRPDKNFPGHHTDQPNPNVRTFNVDVHRDSIRIFSALVTFSLTRRISITGTTALFSATLSTQQVQKRPPWWRRVSSYLRAFWLRVTSLLSSK